MLEVARKRAFRGLGESRWRHEEHIVEILVRMLRGSTPAMFFAGSAGALSAVYLI